MKATSVMVNNYPSKPEERPGRSMFLAGRGPVRLRFERGGRVYSPISS